MNLTASHATRLHPSSLRLSWRSHRLFWSAVVLPTLAAIVYFGFIAADVYISESRFVVRSPERQTASPLGMLLKGQSAAEAFPGVVLNSTTVPPLIVGAVVSFVVGLVCLRWLIAFVVQRSLRSFIIYLVVMAGLTLAWQFFAPGLFVAA